MATKDVHVLIPKTCDYANLDGNRGFAIEIKSRILGGESHPGLSGWPRDVLIRTLREGQRCDDGIADWSDAVGSQEMLAASKRWTRQGLDCPLGPLEGTGPACTLMFTSYDSCWTSDLQNCERMSCAILNCYVCGSLKLSAGSLMSDSQVSARALAD